MANETGIPVYEWAAAEVGDTIPPADIRVEKARIDLYVKTSGDANPLYSDEAFAKSKGMECTAVPISMAMRVAPTRRSVIIKKKGFSHPVRPTPFARWECQFFAPMKPGDVITSDTRLGEKFEKRDRKYVVWTITAHNQRGEKVMEYRSTNCWEGARPEDKSR